MSKYLPYVFAVLIVVASIVISAAIVLYNPNGSATSPSSTSVPSPESSDDADSSDPSREEEPETHFEGLQFYEEVSGEKKLLVIEGVVSEVNQEEKLVTVKRGILTEKIQYGDTDRIYLIPRGESNPLKSDSPSGEEGSFSDIEVGDFISHNPTDVENKRDRAIWIVQKGGGE